MSVRLPVFLINLDRSPDRLIFMQGEAARVGLQFDRIRGVDGKALPDDLRPQFLNPDGSSIGAISAGEIGCYASHLTVYQRILSEGLPCALLLEDDTRLTPQLPETAQAAIASAPEGWDVIHLSSVLRRAVCAIAELPRGHHLIRHMRPPRSTAGYLISRSGAAKMLLPAPRTRTVDMDLKLAHVRNLDILGVYPSPIIWSHHLPSTIGEAYGWRVPMSRRSALQEFFYAVRKLGIGTYAKCMLAHLKSAIEQRFARRPREGIPIIVVAPITQTPPRAQV